MIAIRNAKTGEEKHFSTPQDVANFFAVMTGGVGDWTGHEFVGTLPAADPEFLRHHAETQAAAAATEQPAQEQLSAPAPKKPARKAVKRADAKATPARKKVAAKAPAKKAKKR